MTDVVQRTTDPVQGTFGEDFLARLAGERRAYGLPPRLRQLAERLARDVLALLFPHFTAEVGCRADDVEADALALRALLLETLHVPGLDDDGRTAVVDRFLAGLPVLRDALLADAQALHDTDPAAASVDEIVLAYPGFLATAVYRVAHALHLEGVPLLPRLLTELAHRTTGIDIHPGARIGRSFAIDHGTGVVIGETAVLGERVRLYQGVTIGAATVRKEGQGTKRHPTLGDDVVVYANATILGGETHIGSGSRIGGNVWLTRSVAPHSVVTPTAHVDRRQGTADDDLLEFNI